MCSNPALSTRSHAAERRPLLCPRPGTLRQRWWCPDAPPDRKMKNRQIGRLALRGCSRPCARLDLLRSFDRLRRRLSRGFGGVALNFSWLWIAQAAVGPFVNEPEFV